jgi:pyrroloquinoline quinone biosynthesis protein D
MCKQSRFGPATIPMLPARYRLQWEQAQNCHVLLYPEGMIKLSASACEIVRRIDGRSSVEALIASLEAAFPGAELRADVVEFLEAAHASGWIEIIGA